LGKVSWTWETEEGMTARPEQEEDEEEEGEDGEGIEGDEKEMALDTFRHATVLTAQPRVAN